MFYSLGLTGMVTGMLCNNGLGTITLDVNTMSLYVVPSLDKTNSSGFKSELGIN